MDLSSQEKSIENSKTLASGQTESESNQELQLNCAYDEKVLKNHENTENHTQVFNGSPVREPEDLTGIISSSRKTASESEHLLADASNCVQENETKELNQSGHRKRERQRKKGKLITGSPRVLRSRSRGKTEAHEPVDASSQDVESKEKKRRKTKKIKEDQDNEFSKIIRHLRYLLHRMSYEQNFIDAYAGEGWKGQSLEKLRPEKELERAKSYIIRYKLKIRDLFQRIDKSCEEGRIPESLYDSEGLIDSEDIFCSKCGQTEVHLDNDIILCDGACERGFHQFCLEPPLLKEQVPPGDEGWLCPACDCKVDCFDLLNDSLGTNLSVNDSWEMVFPEAAASGNKLEDDAGLPSDDSGDDDYNPDGPDVEEEVDAEDSSSDESDFSSASEDLGAVANNEQFLGLPSEDSEDDDFNPDKLDSDEEDKAKSSSSDFTSDSDTGDLGDMYKNEGAAAEVQGPVMSENGEEIPKANLEDDDSGPITAKRHVERLNYKKLHDETYGNVSSDSSDEDFFDSEAPRRRKNTKGTQDKDINQKKKKNESIPVRKTSENIDVEGKSNSSADKGSSALGSGDKGGTKSSSKRLGEAATQRLYETFKENQYPDKNARENLVKELNLTYHQISKWFENARWSFNHPEKRSKARKSTQEPTTSTTTEKVSTEQTNDASSATPTSRKRKTKADHNETTETTPTLKEASPMDSSNRNTRKSSRLQQANKS